MQVRAVVPLLLLLSFIPLHADETKDLQKNLQHRFLKQVFVIRHFYSGDHLVFDSEGNLLQGDRSMGYDGCRCKAQLEVRKLEIKKDALVLRGPRMTGVYDRKSRQFSDVSRGHGQVQVDIKLDESQIDEARIADILGKVFLTEKEDIGALLPAAWEAEPVAVKGIGTTETPAIPFKGGHSITAPKPIYTPDPDYSDEARAEKVAGDVILWVVVNESGSVSRVSIVRCLGAGLDQQAVRAVSQWKFKPATKDGKPVAVQINIDVTFHLW